MVLGKLYFDRYMPPWGPVLNSARGMTSCPPPRGSEAGDGPARTLSAEVEFQYGRHAAAQPVTACDAEEPSRCALVAIIVGRDTSLKAIVVL